MGTAWEVQRYGGRLGDGPLMLLIVSIVMTPLCIVCVRLVRVAWQWERGSRKSTPETVAEWREALKAPAVIAIVSAIMVMTTLYEQFAESDVPRSIGFTLFALLGIGVLPTIPASWVAARNIAADVPWEISRSRRYGIYVILIALTVLVFTLSFVEMSNHVNKRIPQTPPTYCYSYTRVQQAIREGLSQDTVGSLVDKGEIAPENLCFTSPLPAGPYRGKP